MRILILNTDYTEFLKSFYDSNKGLSSAPYDTQLIRRNKSLFGVADFYSTNLKMLGHEAWEIHANNQYMQKAWVREHCPKKYYDFFNKFDLRKLFYPFMKPLDRNPSWFFDILTKQIEYYEPDIIINQAIDGISGRFLQKAKKRTKLLIGQIAAPLPESENFKAYDLILTSLPNYVKYFRGKGISCELNRLAFEPKILEKVHDNGKPVQISFVGSMSPYHAQRIQLLEYLCKNVDISIWGNGIKNLKVESPIHKSYKGIAWGLGMYQVLHDSKMTLNHHIEIAGDYANNMRLYEATGSGTLLITDYKKNIGEIFKVGEEVVVYSTKEECAELINYYLIHDKERESIARAGQLRTLQEHNYYNRTKEMLKIINNYIKLTW